MWQELQEEYEKFLEDMKRGETFCTYIDETDYEDEYSHNEIDKCQSDFAKQVKEWLHENKPNEYIVSFSYCVFVMTREEAKKRNIHRYENYVVD